MALLVRVRPFRASFLRTFSTAQQDVVENMEDVVKKEMQGGFATVTLERPKVHNAFSDKVIQRFTDVFTELGAEKDLRGVFVKARGKAFCAGADLNWMKKTASYSQEENLKDAVKLSTMLKTLATLPCPTIALVQGPAYGGGVGLISVCDIAVGVREAQFALSEVKLGILPATISPYVIARIGATNARRFFLTAEAFDAEKAKEIGLLNEVVETATDLDKWEEKYRGLLKIAGPSAVRATKDLISAVAGKSITSDLIHDTARRLAVQRGSKEGVEGLSAFLERRKPSWI